MLALLLAPSGSAIALGSTQPLTEMSTRNNSWGIKLEPSWPVVGLYEDMALPYILLAAETKTTSNNRTYINNKPLTDIHMLVHRYIITNYSQQDATFPEFIYFYRR
jgi:hypothetical protein